MYVILLIGTDECLVKSVVNRVAVQLAKAMKEKGMALLVNHGISEEKVCLIHSIIFLNEKCSLIKLFTLFSPIQLKTAYHYFDEFCKLDEQTKELYLRKSGEGNHGYIKVGIFYSVWLVRTELIFN